MNDFKYNTRKFCIAMLIVGLFYLLLHILTSCSPAVKEDNVPGTDLQVREVNYKGHSYLIFTDIYNHAGRMGVVHNPDCCK